MYIPYANGCSIYPDYKIQHMYMLLQKWNLHEIGKFLSLTQIAGSYCTSSCISCSDPVVCSLIYSIVFCFLPDLRSSFVSHHRLSSFQYHFQTCSKVKLAQRERTGICWKRLAFSQCGNKRAASGMPLLKFEIIWIEVMLFDSEKKRSALRVISRWINIKYIKQIGKWIETSVLDHQGLHWQSTVEDRERSMSKRVPCWAFLQCWNDMLEDVDRQTPALTGADLDFLIYIYNIIYIYIIYVYIYICVYIYMYIYIYVYI